MAPTCSPRSDWSKFSTRKRDGPSGFFMASASLAASMKAVCSLAASPLPSMGEAKAMPPSATVSSDCVRTDTPLESSFASTPLASQKREFVPTKRS